jgi:hypothetical protein
MTLKIRCDDCRVVLERNFPLEAVTERKKKVYCSACRKRHRVGMPLKGD